MRLLLDTHAVIWACHEPERLPEDVREQLESPRNTVFLSAAAAWEIAIKTALGKLRADLDRVVGACARAGFDHLPISVSHAQALRSLDDHHADPFDRILVAQSVVEGCTIVSRDQAFQAYEVPVLWEA